MISLVTVYTTLLPCISACGSTDPLIAVVIVSVALINKCIILVFQLRNVSTSIFNSLVSYNFAKQFKSYPKYIYNSSAEFVLYVTCLLFIFMSFYVSIISFTLASIKHILFYTHIMVLVNVFN